MASPKDTENKAEEKKKSEGGLMGLIALGVVSLGASFAVSFFTAAPAATETAPSCAPGAEGSSLAYAPAPKNQAYTELRDIVVTVGSAPATRYLKMKVAIVTHEDDEKAVRNAEPALVDSFVNFLRSVELTDMEDPSFYADMREQLAYRSQLVLGESVSNGVLITEFLLR